MSIEALIVDYVGGMCLSVDSIAHSSDFGQREARFFLCRPHSFLGLPFGHRRLIALALTRRGRFIINIPTVAIAPERLKGVYGGTQDFVLALAGVGRPGAIVGVDQSPFPARGRSNPSVGM